MRESLQWLYYKSVQEVAGLFTKPKIYDVS